MKLIPRYINTTIISTIFIILLILTGLEVLISFISQLPDIGTGNYNLLQALRFVILDLPYQLYNFIPMAGLIGSLIGLGVLANQSELIVMQAAGYSKRQITLTVLKTALIMSLLAFILGEFIAPNAEHAANEDKAIAESNGQALSTTRGIWIRQGDRFIHVGLIASHHHLQNITSYEFNNQQQLQDILFAVSADYYHHQWRLHQVKETKFFGNRTTSMQFPELVWLITIKPSLLGISDSEPRNMSLHKLHEYINYLQENGLRSNLYEMNFWKRIVQPFSILVMIFLGAPFVFGSLRIVPMGLRILTGVTLGFTFYILDQFFAPLSLLYQIPPFIGAVFPTLIFVGLGMVLVWKMR